MLTFKKYLQYNSWQSIYVSAVLGIEQHSNQVYNLVVIKTRAVPQEAKSASKITMRDKNEFAVAFHNFLVALFLLSRGQK